MIVEIKKYGCPLLFVTFCVCMSLMSSCKHEPFYDDDMVNPMDTTINPQDTMDMDPTGTPCDPDVIYFSQDVLPILVSNCAFSGCHDAASQEDGVILESYATVMETADVEVFNLDDSEIYEVLVDDDLDERMPPYPSSALSAAQINIIATWILQGALDLECDPNAGACDTENVSFSGFVQPLLESHCQGCHTGASPSGGVDLSTHSAIQVYANNGKLYGAISHEAGFEPMPQGGDKLDDCSLDKIKSWIEAGALNN